MVVGGILVVGDVSQVFRFNRSDLLDDETLVGGRIRRIFNRIPRRGRCAELVVEVPELPLFAEELVFDESTTAENEFWKLLAMGLHTLG